MLGYSLKPHVLLFDEYYTDNYDFSKAEELIAQANRIVFMGTSFSVNITEIAKRIAYLRQVPIEVVDPKPVDAGYPWVTYHAMKATDYVYARQRGELN